MYRRKYGDGTSAARIGRIVSGEGALRAGGKGASEHNGGTPFEGMEEQPEGLHMADGGTFFDMPVYAAPCMSAFVGGDIVAGLYALGLFAAKASEVREKSKKARHAALLIDLGTNGEMAITDGQRMVVTATAAGPAFEGDGTMLGTDRIALTAQLLRRGILDETGLLEEPYFTEGVRIEGAKEVPVAGRQIKNECYFKQKDIRSLQMAKAAVRAGVEILWEEMGRPRIEKVFLPEVSAIIWMWRRQLPSVFCPPICAAEWRRQEIRRLRERMNWDGIFAGTGWMQPRWKRGPVWRKA